MKTSVPPLTVKSLPAVAVMPLLAQFTDTLASAGLSRNTVNKAVPAFSSTTTSRTLALGTPTVRSLAAMVMMELLLVMTALVALLRRR